MTEASATRGPCSRGTKEEALRPLKQGGESFDDFLRRMADQYDPDAVTGDEQ